MSNTSQSLNRRCKVWALSLSMLALAGLTGCADHAQGGMTLGAGVGALIGAVAGHQSGRAAEGAGIGAGIGAVAGYIAGNEQDKAESRYYQQSRPSYHYHRSSYNPNCDY